MPAPKGHPPYNVNGEGGRPRRYQPEDIDRFAEEFLKWMDRPDSIWYEDFCLEHDIDTDLLSEWARENERFNGAYKRSKVWQKSKLIKGGLKNEFNSGFTKFVMSNTCGWRDRNEISGNAANPLAVVLDSIDGTTRDIGNGHID